MGSIGLETVRLDGLRSKISVFGNLTVEEARNHQILSIYSWCGCRDLNPVEARHPFSDSIREVDVMKNIDAAPPSLKESISEQAGTRAS